MKGEENELDGLKSEIERLKQIVADYEQLIKDLSAPIIPSIIPDTILVPFTGMLYAERFEMMIAKITEYTFSRPVNTAVIDFTAISKKEIGEVSVFGRYVENLTSTLNLMGVQVLYVGFTPAITQVLVESGLSFVKELKTFSTFKTALQYLMKEKGIAFRTLS
ncbi:STAS domain-containing protein [Bacillus sp. FJAT-42376]|uniref:STAS domain-containing protein n=1 Tax=Bacillus sp. FJAT-42376 TaxID=2014076 RepID=UPI000F50C959|nr:STAS domain-containing protein [Bacillus sp. FJAT-42376]AZB44139.1 STAS domain-containing protein [Bacillus sp. FJAT-42376]